MTLSAEEFQKKFGTPKAAIHVGIDPGVNTGYAVWSSRNRAFVELYTGKAIEVEHKLLDLVVKMAGKAPITVYVEDVRKMRLPKHLQNPGRTKGAGSIGRDVQRWLDFLEFHGIQHVASKISPKEFRTGDAAWFKAKTGWDGRTSEHARSAAGLVWGK